MSFMSRLPRPQASAPTYGPLDDRSYFPGGSFYGADMPMTADSAMRLITVQNCVRVRVATISQLPCHIMEKSGKMRNKAENFYLYEKLHDQPNSWQTASEFWGMVEAHICLQGQMLCYKLGLEGRPVQEIIPIQPLAIVKIEQNPDYSLTYHIRLKNGETTLYPQSKIVHFRGLTLDGINGVNPIEYARETVGLGMSSTRFLSNYFGKGMHPGAIVEHPLTLSSPNHKNLREALKEKYAGLNNAQDLMLLDEGMKIQFPTIKLVDAQYLELMKLGEAQICGLYRVPLQLVQGGDKAPTFASSEQFAISYVVYGVTPDCVNYERVIRRDLLTPAERTKYYAKFSVDALLRGDFTTRMEGFQTAVNACIINPNEARELMEMNPYSGGESYETRTSTVKQDTTQDTGKGANQGAKAIRHLLITSGGNNGSIQARKKDNVDWKKVYKEGNAHWADDMQPSKLAQEFAQKLVDENKKSVLEIGCGNGRDSILFALAGMEVTAIDLVPEAVEIAKENAKNAEVTINFQTGNAEKLQFADESFGGLFTLSVLHSTNMAKSVPEVYRVVKKKGIVSIYVYSNVEKIDGTKKEFVSVDEFINLVKAAGFTLSDIYTTSDEEFDEAGEKHLVIIAELRK